MQTNQRVFWIFCPFLTFLFLFFFIIMTIPFSNQAVSQCLFIILYSRNICHLPWMIILYSCAITGYILWHCRLEQDWKISKNRTEIIYVFQISSTFWFCWWVPQFLVYGQSQKKENVASNQICLFISNASSVKSNPAQNKYVEKQLGRNTDRIKMSHNYTRKQPGQSQDPKRNTHCLQIFIQKHPLLKCFCLWFIN